MSSDRIFVALILVVTSTWVDSARDRALAHWWSRVLVSMSRSVHEGQDQQARQVKVFLSGYWPPL